MSDLKKISIRKTSGANPNTLKGSLERYGYSSLPGTFKRFEPWLDTDNTYRTGLDENALYIDQIDDPVAREQEKEYVRSLYKKAQRLFGSRVDLSENSDFYRKMTDGKMNTMERCPFVRLKGADNVFNLNDPLDLVQFAYLRVHPNVAPNERALSMGKYSACMFYVNDDVVENEVSYNVKVVINEAVGLLGLISLDKKKRIARQLDLPVTDSTSEQETYTRLDNFIKESEKTKTDKNAAAFIALTKVDDEQLAIRDLVKQCILLNVLRERPDGSLYMGSNLYAKSEKEAILKLSSVDNQLDLTELEEALKTKKFINS